tara:strand:+ start:362 stop:625 length:264 start_codon:yes stop_codon:yes gene_type:complete
LLKLTGGSPPSTGRDKMNEPNKDGNKTYFTKQSLFMNQAPNFNFELNADQILDKALESGFVSKVYGQLDENGNVEIDEDKYLMNDNY